MKRERILNVEKEFLELFELGKSYKEISKSLNISQSAISSYIKCNNLIHPSRRNHIHEYIFDSYTEESVYWLGFLWADGYVERPDKGSAIDLEITDLDHAIKYKNFIGASKIVKRDRKNSITYRVVVNSHVITSRLYDLGFGIKDDRINIPNIPEEYLIIFLRGYFDGDGHIRIDKDRFSGIDISGRIEFIKNIYNKFQYFTRIEYHSTHSSRIYTTIKSGKQFLHDIYKNANIYLDRKYKSALLFCEEEVIKLGKIDED